ncbi:hypothetical protein CNECB9_2920025 [Cupriavidus necator]|uniref:Uncharacterized protein n=1 Tax=Cupriavidus necator TaxID=106590 RepID=A0A1K0ITL2_CUPNE|nr:hypothetical protein CNECB9_2920025 [Cupriavidus necator]
MDGPAGGHHPWQRRAGPYRDRAPAGQGGRRREPGRRRRRLAAAACAPARLYADRADSQRCRRTLNPAPQGGSLSPASYILSVCIQNGESDVCESETQRNEWQ